VVVNSDLEVVQFRGRTGRYLEPPVGTATHSILKMAREGLLGPLREALGEARETHAAVSKFEVQVFSDSGCNTCSLDVIPIRMFGSTVDYYLVLFDPATDSSKTPRAPVSSSELESRRDHEGTDDEAQYLRQELLATREYLSSIIQERESANEELKAANEEAQSANEELQSANEELETAKEELQSTNEELATINDELHERNIELQQVNGDLNNILTSVDMPVVILDGEQKIRRFTPIAKRLLNLIDGDIGRPFNQVRTKVDIPELQDEVDEVMETLVPKELDKQDCDGRWYSVRIRPYRTADDRIDGVVIAFMDVHDLKFSTRAAEERHKLTDELTDLLDQPVLVVDEGLQVILSNLAFRQEFEDKVPSERADWSLEQWSDSEKMRPEIEALLAGESVASEFAFVTRHSPPQKYRVHLRKIALQGGRRVISRIVPVED
jgi:two-component system CheB/CheR fusion protein